MAACYKSVAFCCFTGPLPRSVVDDQGFEACGFTKLALAAVYVLAVPAYGGGPSLAMLDQLEAGRWELRESSAPQRICVPNGRRLIQLRHPGLVCDSFVVADGPSEVVVQYTCRGRGYGRTQIRRETNRLVQVQSQGIVDGLPFEFSAEARRIGDCSGG